MFVTLGRLLPRPVIAIECDRYPISSVYFCSHVDFPWANIISLPSSSDISLGGILQILDWPHRIREIWRVAYILGNLLPGITVLMLVAFVIGSLGLDAIRIPGTDLGSMV